MTVRFTFIFGNSIIAPVPVTQLWRKWMNIPNWYRRNWQHYHNTRHNLSMFTRIVFNALHWCFVNLSIAPTAVLQLQNMDRYIELNHRELTIQAQHCKAQHNHAHISLVIPYLITNDVSCYVNKSCDLTVHLKMIINHRIPFRNLVWNYQCCS